ncbi:MAG TPA: ABC transporter permease [Chloroflexi bacterium]|nr:ABC transporter permease [Chloroflexota bacterium]
MGVTAVVFLLLRLSGDPVALLVPPDATEADYQRIRHILGLDQSLPVQYLKFLARVAHGDFGDSFTYKQPAMGLVLERLPATLELTGVTVLLIVIISIPLGLLAAVWRDSLFDYALALITLIGQSMPNFWFGIMLILVFAVELRWLPTSGQGGIGHLVLPVVALASQPLCRATTLMRSTILEILGADYIRTARAKGLRERRVLFLHALRNALIPYITLLGVDLGYLLGGAIVTETVFAWPGLGRLAVDAISRRDFPVVQADVLFVAAAVVVLNFMIDLSYGWLDPRIKVS